MPISRSEEEAERDMARAIADLEARGYGVQGAVSYQAPDGSVGWTICPRIPPEPDLRSPEETRSGCLLASSATGRSSRHRQGVRAACGRAEAAGLGTPLRLQAGVPL